MVSRNLRRYCFYLIIVLLSIILFSSCYFKNDYEKGGKKEIKENKIEENSSEKMDKLNEAGNDINKSEESEIPNPVAVYCIEVLGGVYDYKTGSCILDDMVIENKKLWKMFLEYREEKRK